MKERNRKNIIMVIIAILFIAIAFLAGFMFYNTPANRLSRQLDLGNKYLEEQNYEQAIVEFDKAIAIDPMNERAYIGKAEAYVGMGDYEQAAATYATAVQTIPDGNEVWNAAEQFYLDYAQIYIDDEDYEQALEILEEGYDLLGSEKIYNKIKEITQSVQQQEEEAQRASGMIALPFRLQEIMVGGYDLLDDHFAEMRGLYPTEEGYRVSNTYDDVIFQENAADGLGGYYISNTTYPDDRTSQLLYVYSGWSYMIFYQPDGIPYSAVLTLDNYGGHETDYAELRVPFKPGGSYEDWCNAMQIAEIKENGSQPEQDGDMVNIPEVGEYPSYSFGVSEEEEVWVFMTDEYRGIYSETRSEYGVWCELEFHPPMTYSGERRALGYRIRVSIGTDGIISKIDYECDL